jgi:biopolymer transport protein ExbD
MAIRRRASTAPEATVDLTPCIDMTFILLIFFMVSTTFVKDMKVDINRPAAATPTVASTKAVRVYIDKAGETYIEGQSVRIWTLQSRIRDLLKAGTSKSVLVVTDEVVPSGRLVEVVDQARLAGAEDIGVATGAEAGEG